MVKIGGSDGSVGDSLYVVGHDAMSLDERSMTFQSHFKSLGAS
jgi:hypothetical protein